MCEMMFCGVQTGVIPMFVPFAHLFAAVLTAALTGSMYYVISSPKDPKYVVAPAIRGPKNRRDIKARVEAWYARRQQKKIYSPLVESLLALYLGLEWMHVRLLSCFHFCMYILILYKTK
jgi:hypothetical protein